MKKNLDMVRAFHQKFQAGIQEKPGNIDLKRAKFRYQLMKDEVEEYLPEVEKADVPNIAKELCDVLYAVYGTIIEHGLQDKIEAVFAEVHQSNMSKDYSDKKMIKGENYVEANVQKIFSESS